ncbi:hypothetical protein B0T10DRAFT_162881 [Thelonectria olida]|uniref:rRNA adenine N(6)-methyltransferase n=1 Tax=Thelonectria olida TaxID=1576542 RepID=A0A9P8WFT3_9HYPO|nr:hypothetical protein B0T10DRAFT_162881 [Thelonectria olida]
MLACFKGARTVLPRHLRLAALAPVRHVATKATTSKAIESESTESETTEPKTTKPRTNNKKPPAYYSKLVHKATNDVSERLLNIGLWPPRRGSARKGVPRGDRHRLNIVSEDLCDDIVKYLGDSLKRHEGCDLIDINPGVGVWSRSLHEAVKPRKHILMEPDEEVYAPFLGDLLAKDGVELVPKHGIIWRDLNETLNDKLPHQHIPDKKETPKRNDTLLVSLNLAYWPNKSYQGFSCVSQMVLYQVLSSIRTSTLFQKYGRVRMLVWIRDESARKVIPRTITRRKRGAFEAHLSLEYAHKVAGPDTPELRTELRDWAINTESARNVIQTMQKLGLTPPPGRETLMYKNLMSDPELLNSREALAGTTRPRLEKPYREQLEEAEAEYLANPGEKPSDHLKYLRLRERTDQRDNEKYLELLQMRDTMMRIGRSDPEFAKLEAAYNDKALSFKKNQYNMWMTISDNYHIFRQEEPGLLWDQRPYEPLVVNSREFFPNVPCTLLDLQPKAVHPLVRGVESEHSADISDLLLKYWYAHTHQPAYKAMDSIWPGFGELYDEIPSLTDPALGGSLITGEGVLRTRAINTNQFEDILQAFMGWVFRPSYATLLARLTDDESDEAKEEARTTALGSGI